MAHLCEVCASLKPGTNPSEQPLVELTLDGRSVMLCRGHARIAENARVRSYKALREFYGCGQRSHVARRRPGAGGVEFEQRASRGRRASDGARST